MTILLSIYTTKYPRQIENSAQQFTIYSTYLKWEATEFLFNNICGGKEFGKLSETKCYDDDLLKITQSMRKKNHFVLKCHSGCWQCIWAAMRLTHANFSTHGIRQLLKERIPLSGWISMDFSDIFHKYHFILWKYRSFLKKIIWLPLLKHGFRRFSKLTYAGAIYGWIENLATCVWKPNGANPHINRCTFRHFLSH